MNKPIHLAPSQARPHPQSGGLSKICHLLRTLARLLRCCQQRVWTGSNPPLPPSALPWRPDSRHLTLRPPVRTCRCPTHAPNRRGDAWSATTQSPRSVHAAVTAATVAGPGLCLAPRRRVGGGLLAGSRRSGAQRREQGAEQHDGQPDDPDHGHDAQPTPQEGLNYPGDRPIR